MEIKFKKLSETAVLPAKGYPTDAGFDLYADETVTVPYGETAIIPTNIAIELPEGMEAQVRPRSSTNLNKDLDVKFGTIDSSYRGSIGIIAQNTSHESGILWYVLALMEEQANGNALLLERINELKNKYPYDLVIQKGERIAQLVFAAVPAVELVEADELSPSDRGDKGYGSTGSGKQG